MKKEDCIGCKEHFQYTNEIYRRFKEDIVCPCSICLIKVMCTRGCDLYTEHMDKIIEIEKGLDYEKRRM